jgi:DHA2 family multidrug resistance protein
VGLGLIATGLGCLEVVLDKGQEEDWFHSSFILGFTIVAAVTLVSFVAWEWNHDNPIVDLKMFKRRSFATANVMMLMLGIALFGSTVLLPQYMQVLMGYTAQQSGMALSPGGLVVIGLLPLVGILVSKVDTRYLAAFGFAVLSGSLFYMTRRLDIRMDFATAVELRAIQSVGMAFLFVPIQSISYAGVPPQKNNQVSGIMNLSRNMGGDIGIAFVTTLIVRRAQMHQANLSRHTTAYDPSFQAGLSAMARSMEHAGASSVDAAHQATAAMYRQLVLQSTQLAYIDALWILAVGAALMVPLVWLARKPQSAPPAGAH